MTDYKLSAFKELIHPVSLNAFVGKSILECCGGGRYAPLTAPYAGKVTVADSKISGAAMSRFSGIGNIKTVEADPAVMDLMEKFDIILFMEAGRVPDSGKVVLNLIRHLRPGGRLILMAPSREGALSMLAASLDLAMYLLTAGRCPIPERTSRETAEGWLGDDLFTDVSVAKYKGSEWLASGTLKSEPAD